MAGACIVPATRHRVQAPILTDMIDLFRFVVFALLAGIVSSLGVALYQLSSGKGDSQKMIRALALRVALSIGLFILLLIGWRAGWITPRTSWR